MRDQQQLSSEVDKFVAAGPSQTDREQDLDRLIDLHDKCQERRLNDSAAKLREAFLLALDDSSSLTREPRFCDFLTERVEPSDFAKLKWQSPARVTRFCEILYGFQFPNDKAAERIRKHVATLLEDALHQFETEGEYEQMLHLIQTAPSNPMLLNGELRRLRNRVQLYEMNRVRRNRRLLYAYLVFQALLVTVIFPFLFVNAENGKIRDAVEKATDVDIRACKTFCVSAAGEYYFPVSSGIRPSYKMAK